MIRIIGDSTVKDFLNDNIFNIESYPGMKLSEYLNFLPDDLKMKII